MQTSEISSQKYQVFQEVREPSQYMQYKDQILREKDFYTESPESVNVCSEQDKQESPRNYLERENNLTRNGDLTERQVTGNLVMDLKEP